VSIVGEFYEKNDLEGATEFLMNEAQKRWIRFDAKNIDDITFIIIFIYRF